MANESSSKKYDKVASNIVRLVGGESNIESLVHCATRLRFVLNDTSKADKPSLEQVKEVLTVVESGGQYQVVIGNQVPEVYSAIMEQLNVNSPQEKQSNTKKRSITSRIFEIISGSFSPLLPALAGSGMIKALLSILITLSWITAESHTYLILAAASNAVFYFLPILLGITLATKLGSNPYLGGVIGAALMEPNFTGILTSGVERTTFLGIPVIVADYASTVFPVFIAVSIFTVLERHLKRIIPKSVQLFLVPMLSLIIVVPLTVIAFGPFGVYVSQGIASGIAFLVENSGIVAGLVIGGLVPFLVVLGVHWGLVPIILLNLSELGADPIIGMWLAATFAQTGIALGVFLKTKDSSLKAAAGSSTMTALLAGVTEPILYGIVLRYKRLIPLMILAGATGGVLLAVFKVNATSFVLQSVFSFGAFTPIGYAIFGAFVSLIVATVLVLIFGIGENTATNASHKRNTTEEIQDSTSSSVTQEMISTPINGTIKALKDVNDAAFSIEAMGKGIAIVPTEGKVFAPFNGKIVTTFPSKHAIGLLSHNGAELLIHVGLNTVKLKGEHFILHIKEGDEISTGQLLMEFDIVEIQKAGFDLTTPVVVTNTEIYKSVLPTEDIQTSHPNPVITLVP